MLAARREKARRLLDLHRDLQRLEEQRIAALRGREIELATMQEELVGTLSGEGGLTSLFTSSIVKRLKSLSEEAVRVGEEIKRRTAMLQTIAARTKHAERMSRTYEQEYARVQAAQELRDIIERVARPPDASLP
jgi:hypothetical protein